MQKIDRFGIEAILGRRQLYFGELQRMTYAEMLVTAYLSRKAAENRGLWAEKNPRLDEILKDVEMLLENS